MGHNLRVIKNAIFLYGLTFSNYFIGLILFPYLSRTLSVETFGMIGFATSFCLFFQMIVEYGFQLSTTAKISINRDDSNMISRIVSAMTASKCVLIVIATIIYMFSVLLITVIRDNILVISLFMLDSFAKALLPDAYFRGIERMKDVTVRTVAIRSLIVVSTVIFVRNDMQAVLYPFIMFVCDSLALIWAFYLIHKDNISFQLSSSKEVISSLKHSFWFFVSRISVSVNGSLGSLFLGTTFMPNSVEMGLYSGATRISTAGEQMISPISDALYPAMVKRKDYRFFLRVVAIGGILWLGVCSLVFFLSDYICLFILGEEYISAGIYLKVLVIGVFVSFFNYLFGYPALSPLHKENFANFSIVISAIYCVASCSILCLLQMINPLSICIVFASKDIISFGVRFFVFIRYKDTLIRAADVSIGD